MYTEDLISRQAAIDALGERPMVWTESDYELGARNQYDADVLALETVPSAQPEIIRCKDCEHYDDGLCRRWKYSHVTSEDSFCSGAERREE